jgi:hypothetical protein
MEQRQVGTRLSRNGGDRIKDQSGIAFLIFGGLFGIADTRIVRHSGGAAKADEKGNLGKVLMWKTILFSSLRMSRRL